MTVVKEREKPDERFFGIKKEAEKPLSEFFTSDNIGLGG